VTVTRAGGPEWVGESQLLTDHSSSLLRYGSLHVGREEGNGGGVKRMKRETEGRQNRGKE
jgi:hypothetical protein